MPLEDLTGSTKYISDLNKSWPLGTDFMDSDDNHLRGVKNVLDNSFPNINGPVTVTPDELNTLTGATGVIETRLDALEGVSAIIEAGTRMLFQQAAAPTGWTRDGTLDNRALRVSNGTGFGAAAGTTGFQSVFGAGKASGSTVITTNMLPLHTHGAGSLAVAAGGVHSHTSLSKQISRGDSTGSTTYMMGTGTASFNENVTTSSEGSHTHTLSGSTASAGLGLGHTHTLSLDLLYSDVIVAVKD